jgi:fused signal recognition particle receptor
VNALWAGRGWRAGLGSWCDDRAWNSDMTITIVVAVVIAVALLVMLLTRKRPKSALPRAGEATTGQIPAPHAVASPLVESPKPLAAEPPAHGPTAGSAPRADEAVDSVRAESAPNQPAVPPEAPVAPLTVAVAVAAPNEDLRALKKGLASTRSGFITRLAKLFGGGKKNIDAELLEEIEEVLLTADVGVKTSQRMLENLRERMRIGELKNEDDVWSAIRELATEILSVEAKPIALAGTPSLILVAGVNGVGKTTTIGKLASRYISQGHKVILAAGDTYRAAAVLQLEVWGKRVDCPVVKGKEGADPGSVIFDTVKRAQLEGYDLVIADTAGRLHTKAPLMEELKKLERTTQKALGGRAPDEIFLVLDATTGQNAVQQMHMFREALPITGVVLTKLDGTAKGGVVLGIVDEHKLPIRFIGLGEKVEDLREFDAKHFAEALFERPDAETIAA